MSVSHEDAASPGDAAAKPGNSNITTILAVLIIELIIVGATCAATVHFHHHILFRHPVVN